MSAMHAVVNGRRPSTRLSAREHPCEYVFELAVGDFADSELTVEALGPRITVHGDQVATGEEDGNAFRLHERLEESFRLPDDAVPDGIKVVHKHDTLEIRAPRTHLDPRRLPIEHETYRINPDAEPC